MIGGRRKEGAEDEVPRMLYTQQRGWNMDSVGESLPHSGQTLHHQGIVPQSAGVPGIFTDRCGPSRQITLLTHLSTRQS
jgi:hypothetical protein